jgi:hypothetical protein
MERFYLLASSDSPTVDGLPGRLNAAPRRNARGRYAALANTYRPLATRTNSGDGPTEWEASTQLTEFAETVSPSDVSTAAWTCTTRIGPAWSAIASHTASSTQPGRRGRNRRLVMVRGWAPLALRPASFLVRRLSPDRVSCAASAARSAGTILSIAPECWFDRTPVVCIFGELNVANRTTLAPIPARRAGEHGGPWGPFASVSASVCATTRPDRENVDHPFGVPTIEDHSPLADTQPPQALCAAQQLDIPLGQRTDRSADPFPVPPAKPPQRLQRGRTDLDPPSARLSQRSAPPRPRAKGRRALSAPAERPADPPR